MKGLHRLAWLALAAALTWSGVAHADPLPDWRATDVKGRTVDTKSYRGKVLLMFINSPELKGQMWPITGRLILKYGDHARLEQVTLVDLREAPLTWQAAEQISGTVTEKIAAIHDWNVTHIKALLKEHDKPPIRGLDRKLHVILDWEGGLIQRYPAQDSQKTISIVVIGPQGDLIGAWPGHQLDRAIQAIDATLKTLAD
ncbi:MAG: hypothetical protein CMH57_01800 [Myxococcales bacterium]|nr:hypothetical protein [Myxococcales bacterium]